MEEIQDKLNAILSNPQMMSQLMSMAQAFGNSQPPQAAGEQPPTPPQTASTSGFPGSLDPAMIQKLIGFTQKTGIDKKQQTLLTALKPYLNRERIQKLEKAMRAARLASAATALLGSQGNLFSSGR